MTKTLCYHVERRRSDGGYYTDHLRVMELDATDSAARLAGTVDNADGYGTADAAEKMGRMFAALLRDGHARFYEHAGDHSLTIDWLIYRGDAVRTDPETLEPHYCQPHIHFPPSLGACRWALGMLDKIGRRIEKAAHAARVGAGYVTTSEPHPVSDATFDVDGALRAACTALDKLGAVRVQGWRDPTRERCFASWYYVAAREPLAAPIPLAA